MRQMTLPGITGRGAFTVERPSPDKLALVLALAIAFISGSLGFLFGRMSMVPASSGAAVEAVAPKPAQSSKSRSTPAESKSVRKTELRNNDVQADTAQSSASTSPANPAKEATSATEDASAPHPVVLLNGPQSKHAEKTSETTARTPSSDGKAGSEASSNDTSGAANESVRAVAASGPGNGASSSDGSAGSEAASNDTSRTANETVRAAAAPDPGNDASDAGAPAARSEEPAARLGARADAEALDRCASQYRSFRRSDGTYQPYDGGPRKLCQYLR